MIKMSGEQPRHKIELEIRIMTIGVRKAQIEQFVEQRRHNLRVLFGVVVLMSAHYGPRVRQHLNQSD